MNDGAENENSATVVVVVVVDVAVVAYMNDVQHQSCRQGDQRETFHRVLLFPMLSKHCLKC